MKHLTILLLLLLSFMDNTVKAQQFKSVDDSLAYSLGVLILNLQ